MNIWAGVIIGLLAIGGAAYGYKLKAATQNISMDIKGRIHSLDFSKAVFAIDVIIKNPSNVNLYILQPFVTVLYKGSEIASSNVSDDIITIAPFAPAPLKTIFLNASYLNMSGVALELLKKLQDKKAKVTVQAKVLVTLVVGLSGKIPKRLKDYKGSKRTISLPAIIKDMTF